MNKPSTIHPTHSESFEIGDKVTTILLEPNQLFIGKPCYGIDDRHTEYPFDLSAISPAVELSNFRSSHNAEYGLD